MTKSALYNIFTMHISKILYSIKHNNLYWDSSFGYFVFVNDLSFTKCVTRKSFTAYLLASLLHSCFGRFGTIWMSALIYRCKRSDAEIQAIRRVLKQIVHWAEQIWLWNFLLWNTQSSSKSKDINFFCWYDTLYFVELYR